jgi:hypothetical protein
MHYLSFHVESYRQEVWKLINSFDAFNITSIPHSQNVVVDSLANGASIFTPISNGFNVELLSMPSVPDNVTNWRVFNDDSQIIIFLTNVDMFQGSR